MFVGVTCTESTSFRAVTGAASLKHLATSFMNKDDGPLPRRDRRGLVEA